MKRVAFLLLATTTCGIAQERDGAARQLTVEVLSARKVMSARIEPLGQNELLRLCAGCKPKAVRKVLVATVRGDALELGAAERTREVILEGAFRIVPDGDAKPMSAAGVWKLTVAHGEMRALLTLDSERYVALALRGEAGAQEPLESMKAMAVLVRTFALENAERHRGDGFDLCDSTHCQVLKFGTPSALVERAVRETTGETLWFGARPAKAFYTQNCGGQSEAASQVWGRREKEPYLKEHADPYCTRRGAAQWHAEIPLDQVERVAQNSGWKLPARIDGVLVAKRTEEGRVLQVEFEGAGARVPVTGSSLRFALDRALGWNQMRSDWYTVSLHGNGLRFDGRGYGHGVGLCQAGATQMAAEGHSAEEILDFYFPGTRIGVTPEDHGWTAAHGAGWSLRTTGSVGELAKLGDAAWGRALTLYSPRATKLEPEVWEMPTTELFRQATGEPGWMLASTQGERVFLQPEGVLKRDGKEEDTLLHEFLHVLVESEASAQTPLWLREGLVEALAEERPMLDGAGHVDLTALNLALMRPASQAESQRAHAASAQVVRALLLHDGLERVRQWVRSGSVPDAAVRTLALVPAEERPVPSRPR